MLLLLLGTFVTSEIPHSSFQNITYSIVIEMTKNDKTYLDDDIDGDMQETDEIMPSALHSREGNSTELLIQTIENMTHLYDLNRFQNSHQNHASTVCANPIHFHSLAKLSGLSSIVKSKFRVCAVCNSRISIISGDVVTCLACGIFLHRSCTGTWKDKNVPHCSINLGIIHERSSALEIKSVSSPDNIRTDSQAEATEGCCDSLKNKTEMNNVADLIPTEENEQVDDDDDDDDAIWSAFGPPSHWAMSSPEMLKGLKGSSQGAELSQAVKQEENSTEAELEEIQDWKLSLSKLSMTLQQNLKIIKKHSEEVAVEHVRSDENRTDLGPIDQETDIQHPTSEDGSIESTKAVLRNVSERIQNHSDLNDTDQKAEEDNAQDISDVLTEVKSKPMQISPRSSKSVQGVKDSVQIIKKGQMVRKNMGVASIGGCIVGGVAGLVIAGPAGESSTDNHVDAFHKHESLS
jgi:hypothetical protein